MTNRLTLEGEGNDLSAARASIQGQLTTGYIVARERVVADGKHHSTEHVGDTREEALRLARQDIPEDAEVVEESCIREAESKIEHVQAFQDTELPPKIRDRFGGDALIKSSSIQQRARKGIFGLGKKAGTYEVRIFVPAKARCTWKQRAKIVAELGIDPKVCPSAQSGKHKWGRGSRCEACGKRGCLLCGKDILPFTSGTPTPDHGIKCSSCSSFICNACLADKWGISQSWQISSKRCPACRQHGLGAILYRL